jgi:hypothetical protein
MQGDENLRLVRCEDRPGRIGRDDGVYGEKAYGGYDRLLIFYDRPLRVVYRLLRAASLTCQCTKLTREA